MYKGCTYQKHALELYLFEKFKSKERKYALRQEMANVFQTKLKQSFKAVDNK